MEQPKRISLYSTVSWFEGYDQLVDDWATDDLLENESFLLEEQTAVFLPPPPSLIEASEADADGSDDDSVFYNQTDELSWEDQPLGDDGDGMSLSIDQRAYRHKKSSNTVSTESWEERRRNLAFSIQRSKTTRSWIESNIMNLCGQNTKEAMLKTLQSTTLMEALLKQQRGHSHKRKQEG